jgi:hypothetical protein
MVCGRPTIKVMSWRIEIDPEANPAKKALHAAKIET